MRGQKGITLVALIITIVVLLILAVVAIGAVRESNIINHASNAATSYNTQQGIENTQINTAEQLLDNIVTNVTTKSGN